MKSYLFNESDMLFIDSVLDIINKNNELINTLISNLVIKNKPSRFIITIPENKIIFHKGNEFKSETLNNVIIKNRNIGICEALNEM